MTGEDVVTCQFVTARGPLCEMEAVVRLASTVLDAREWKLCSPHAEVLLWATNTVVRTRLGLQPVAVAYDEDFRQALDDARRSV